MQVILEIAAGLALAVRQVERGVDIDIPHVLTFLHDLLELAVIFVEELPLGLAGRGAGRGDEDEGAIGILLADAGDVFADAADRGGGFVAGVHVVPTALVGDHTRVIGQGDAIHVAVDLGGVGTAKTAVDHRVRLHLFGDVLPHAQRAGAAEEQGVLGRRVGLIGGFEGGDILGHAQRLLGQGDMGLGDVGREGGDREEAGE